jgi:hypothetical protein
MGESDVGMNSQSHTTTLGNDMHEENKHWPYSFESPFRVDRVDSGLGGSISLAQLDAVTESNELVLPPPPHYYSGGKK